MVYALTLAMLGVGVSLIDLPVLFNAVVIGTPTGNGTTDFSIATGDDTGLLALLEDI